MSWIKVGTTTNQILGCHSHKVTGANIEISREDFDTLMEKGIEYFEYKDGVFFEVTPPLREERALATEIDELKARIEKLERR